MKRFLLPTKTKKSALLCGLPWVLWKTQPELKAQEWDTAGHRIESEEEREIRKERRTTPGSCMKLVTLRAADFLCHCELS